MNFSRDGQRNDGSPGVPFQNGERMDDLKIFAGRPEENKRYELLIDDVIFFANDPDLPPEPEPFPKRVLLLAAFDTGPKEKYWPGDFELSESGLPPDSYWRVARAVQRKERKTKWIRLGIEPMVSVGARTKLRFRYYLGGASQFTVQDNRHVRVNGLRQNAWTTLYLDFSRDARRNDGTRDSFTAGNRVDDLFIFVEPENGKELTLLVDEVVLYDAGEGTP